MPNTKVFIRPFRLGFVYGFWRSQSGITSLKYTQLYVLYVILDKYKIILCDYIKYPQVIYPTSFSQKVIHQHHYYI